MIRAEARGAWDEIEARLRPYVARRIPAGVEMGDVLQDIFLKLYRGQETLRNEDSFGGWVYRIAERSITDHLRAHLKQPLAPAELTEATRDAPTPAPFDDDLAPELAQCVALFVARLPSPFREAVTLTELQGVTHRNAADMLAVPLSTLKSRVARGREKIRRMFDQCCELTLDSRGRVIQCDPRAMSEIPSDCRAAAAEWAAGQRMRL